MKKTLLAILSFSAACPLLAQEFINPNLLAMVETERAFVKMAKEQNTRDAFLFFLTEDAVTSGPNGPVNGKEGIRKQTPATAWLYWEVAFSDIAASGDFGYNSGPWEFRASKTDEKPVAYGEFNSIWKKQPDGTWKNAVDIGVRHGAPTTPVKFSTSRIVLTKNKKKSKKGGTDDMVKAEMEFLSLRATDRKGAYKKFLSIEARILRSDQLPLVTEEERDAFINNVAENPSHIEFIDSGVASSNDLGYAYGKGDIAVTRDNKTENKIATYFRVWKKEDGKHWKIVLEVLSF